MANDGRDVDFDRLINAVNRARLTLRRFRAERRQAVRMFAGNHWGAEEAAAPEKRFVNMISQYVGIVGKKLIAKNPRVMYSTFNAEARAVVEKMQGWANTAIVSMDLASTLQRVVTDALFCVGIAKVALATPGDSASAGWNLRTGSAFVESVDLDDFVFDAHARDFEHVGFMGHRFRLPLEVVRNSTIYSSARKDLVPSDDVPYNQEGDERVNVLGRGQIANSDRQEWEDHVDLWEIYVPRKKLVLTFGSDSAGSPIVGAEPLRVQDWVGPDRGPYHVLTLGRVPGNAMPKAPIMDLMDLDELLNKSWRKLARQADRQKEVTFVAGSASEDGSRVMNANDGEIIKVDNPEGFQKVEFGGPNNALFAFALQTKETASNVMGNLETLGGLGAQAKTARQEELLNSNSSATIADLQDSVLKWTAGVCEALGWYWHHDPFHVMKTVYSPPGVPNVQTTLKVTPQDRQQIAWDDLELLIDPYSLAHSTPQQRGQALDQLMMNIVMPMMPILQQQGIGVDLAMYLKKRAAYLDMPDLPEIITVSQPVPQGEGGDHGGDAPGMPASTSREYVRRSESEKTQSGQDAVLKNTLMGGDSGGSGPMALPGSE